MAEGRPGRNKIPSITKESIQQSQHHSLHQVHSPNRTSASSIHALPLSSPIRAAHGSAFLPSPSGSSGFTAPTLPPILSPSVTNQNPAHSAHLQDLQHQVSVKTLAYTTLQREYDSLLQKLERQRTKCSTLEKKFEVSDAEINTLTDERDKLLIQIGDLESQLEDLVRARDRARKEVVVNGAQYMRIVEMASKLQAQSAREKSKWDREKKDLEARIKQLEGGYLVEPEVIGSVSEAESVVSASVELTENISCLRRRHREALHSCNEACKSHLQVGAHCPLATNPDVEVSALPSNNSIAKHAEKFCPLSTNREPNILSPYHSGLGERYEASGPRMSLEAAEIEIVRLRNQNREFQARLQRMIDESRLVKATASSLMESGERIRAAGHVADRLSDTGQAFTSSEEPISAVSDKRENEDDCAPMEVDNTRNEMTE